MTRRSLVLLLFLTNGCLMGPNYKRPEIPTPATWREMPAAEAESLANMPWWELFQDPVLQELIRTALQENRDLQIAIERIEEARARYGFVKADLYPQVDANATAGGLDSGHNGPVKVPEDEKTSTGLFQLNASVFWELDFFGRIRRATEAEKALLMGTEEARRAVVLTLVSDVATAYVLLREFDSELQIALGRLESSREYLDLAKTRFEGGLTSELDMRQAEAEFFRTEAFVHDFERLVSQQENFISVLIGRNPGPIPRGQSLYDLPAPPLVPAGLPSELLDRRPDLREAEEFLHAQTANIGQAKALLYPRIALTGHLGFESTDLGDLFNGPSKVWSLAANLLQPIFNAGKNKNRVRITESQQRQALYGYEQAILIAFQEVEDSLVGYRKGGQKRTSQGQRVRAERKVLELAEVRYRGGVAAYLEVLDAQRSVFAAELDEATAIREHLVSLIQLYKALGGGWTDSPPATGAPPDGATAPAGTAAPAGVAPPASDTPTTTSPATTTPPAPAPTPAPEPAKQP